MINDSFIGFPDDISLAASNLLLVSARYLVIGKVSNTARDIATAGDISTCENTSSTPGNRWAFQVQSRTEGGGELPAAVHPQSLL